MTPTALLLHGFTHTGSSWDPVVAALGERYRVLAPDIRGHGAAADADPVTLEAVLTDLDALTPRDGVVLAGYSMGGRIALHAALAMPNRIRRLVLIGASPGIADAAEREQRRLADERHHDRRAARARGRARVLHAAPGQLIAEGAQQEIGVGGGHDLVR